MQVAVSISRIFIRLVQKIIGFGKSIKKTLVGLEIDRPVAPMLDVSEESARFLHVANLCGIQRKHRIKWCP